MKRSGAPLQHMERSRAPIQNGLDPAPMSMYQCMVHTSTCLAQLGPDLGDPIATLSRRGIARGAKC